MASDNHTAMHRASTEKIPEDLPPTLRIAGRFGEISPNEYVTRHNPHPKVVTYFTDIQGRKIRTIHDPECPKTMVFNWSEDRARVPVKYSVGQLNRLNAEKLMEVDRELQRRAARVNDSMNKSKAKTERKPTDNSSPWQEEIQKFTTSVMDALRKEDDREKPVKPRTSDRNNMLNYSTKTGRLNEASRSPTRGGTRNSVNQAFDSKVEFSESEKKILRIVGQLLNLPNDASVGSWISQCTQQERELVMNIVRSVLLTLDDDANADSSVTKRDDVKTKASNRSIATSQKAQNGGLEKRIEPLELSKKNGHGETGEQCVTCPHCHYSYRK